MLYKKAGTTGLKAAEASLIRKRLTASFIFACMLVNGFAMSTVEIGRHSLFMITVAATQNVISSVIGKCNDSLAEVSSKVYSYVETLLFDNVAQSAKVNSGKSAGKEDGANGQSKTTGIVITSLVKKIKRTVHDNSEKIVSGYAFKESLLGSYDGNKVRLRDMCGLSLLFLVFIAAIRQRKGISERIIITNKIWKTRISA